MIDAARKKCEVAVVDIDLNTSFNNQMQSVYEAVTHSFAPIINTNEDGYQDLDLQIAKKTV